MSFFFYFFGFLPLDFCPKSYWSSINHHVMAIILEKVVSIFAGNLYLGRNYLITTVQIRNDFLPYLKIWKHGLSAFFECTHHFLKISWKRAISSMLSFFQRIRFQPSIRDRVQWKKNLALKKPIIKAILCNFSMRLLKYF